MAPKLQAVTGNQAIAEAMRQINPDVCAAYPITPSTEVMQRFAAFVANGKVDTELVTVESEHSAMSACIGASAAGGRVMTATSSQGLALMWEMLFIASGMRLPIVMTLVNRALSAPINIHGDHSDGMGARDCGWVQLWSENGQEAYDNLLQAVRIAEHPDVRLPAMVCLDGFIISHSIESMEFLPDDVVKDFVGEFKPVYPLLDVDNPVTYGPLVLPDYYMEFKRQQHEAMKNAKRVVLEIAKEFEKVSGRSYGYFEEYKLEDADIAIVVMNSAAGTTKDIIDEFRNQGLKVGLLKPRLFRPFPYEEVADALSNAKVIAVLDRAESFGGFGPVYMEIAAAMTTKGLAPLMFNRIYGLGGRDYMPEHAREVIEQAKKVLDSGKIDIQKDYLGVRE
ncbi:MAG: pyruvate ferredoxin oxidoreductase [Nitrospirae bacterium]|nr:MAG: pyruvate ferredoxin oxidoreductase [Nitrospirota bacterium]